MVYVRWAAWLVAIAAGLACAMTPDRLPPLERRFYANIPDPAEQARFLELADEARIPYLQRTGLWQEWMSLPPRERELALRGDLEPGFHEFAVYMAWGPPADTRHWDRGGRPVVVHTFIRCSSGPRAGRYVRSNLDCDGTSDERLVTMQDGIVTEIRLGT